MPRPSWCRRPEGAKVGGGGDDAFRSCLRDPSRLFHAFLEAGGLELGARVAAGLVEFARMSCTVGRPKRSSA